MRARYEFDDVDDTVIISRLGHVVAGCVCTAAVSMIDPRWAWLAVGLLVLPALFWPYVLLCEASLRDAVVRAPLVVGACGGVALVAELSNQDALWTWLAVPCAIALAAGVEWLAEFDPSWDAAESYAGQFLVGVVASVVGTATITSTPLWTWFVAAVLILVVVTAELWDQTARRPGGHPYSPGENTASPSEKVVFVVSLAGLAALAAWAAETFPLRWVWIATPLVYFLSRLDPYGGQILGPDHLGDLVRQRGYRDYADPRWRQ